MDGSTGTGDYIPVGEYNLYFNLLLLLCFISCVSLMLHVWLFYLFLLLYPECPLTRKYIWTLVSRFFLLLLINLVRNTAFQLF